MIHKSVVAAVLLSASLVASAEVENIDNAKLARLAADGVTVIDIRTEPEWKATGVIPGSKLLTFVDERGQVDVPQWLSKVKLAVKLNEPVILICRSGNRSRAATQLLSDKAGYKTVYNATTGLNSWIAEGRPVVPLASALTK
jgi:rhodanese-related sulfurtransferase